MRKIFFEFVIALVFGALGFFLYRNLIISAGVFGAVVLLFLLYGWIQVVLIKSTRVKKIEDAFPDFLQLVSSNLRAGMTIDKAMILSAREEFDPLDKEIMKAGKEIATGHSVEDALLSMSKRIGSEKITKTILLIISGLKAGGNLAILLEETAVNIKERDFVEKRAASNVLMYVIFIFVAVSIGAPALFSLSSVLVKVLTNILSTVPEMPATSLPFTLSGIKISVEFVTYFCVVFIIVLDILAALVLGLVSKGEEKEGYKYIIPLLVISLVVFFAIRYLLSGFMGSLFG